MTKNVSLAIVSHSPKIAEGVASMVKQMVGNQIQIAYCGGDPDGNLGCDVSKIMETIQSVYSDSGTAIFVDIGGAHTNSEVAIEMLPENMQSNIIICNAPIVEGAIVAATEASAGSKLEKVIEAAENYVFSGAESLETNNTNGDYTTGVIKITNPHGLHARPSVKITQLSKRFNATIELSLDKTSNWINAKSVSSLMKFNAKNGDIVHYRVKGKDADSAVEQLINLIKTLK